LLKADSRELIAKLLLIQHRVLSYSVKGGHVCEKLYHAFPSAACTSLEFREDHLTGIFIHFDGFSLSFFMVSWSAAKSDKVDLNIIPSSSTTV
jgi:hypothetical protein